MEPLPIAWGHEPGESSSDGSAETTQNSEGALHSPNSHLSSLLFPPRSSVKTFRFFSSCIGSTNLALALSSLLDLSISLHLASPHGHHLKYKKKKINHTQKKKKTKHHARKEDTEEMKKKKLEPRDSLIRELLCRLLETPLIIATADLRVSLFLSISDAIKPNHPSILPGESTEMQIIHRLDTHLEDILSSRPLALPLSSLSLSLCLSLSLLEPFWCSALCTPNIISPFFFSTFADKKKNLLQSTGGSWTVRISDGEMDLIVAVRWRHESDGCDLQVPAWQRRHFLMDSSHCSMLKTTVTL